EHAPEQDRGKPGLGVPRAIRPPQSDGSFASHPCEENAKVNQHQAEAELAASFRSQETRVTDFGGEANQCAGDLARNDGCDAGDEAPGGRLWSLFKHARS